MELVDEQGASKTPTIKSTDTTSSEEIHKLTQRVTTLEKENKELNNKVLQLFKLLEENPGHRRVQRVSMQIWVPGLLASSYYLWTGDMTTSLAIMSYGISTLLVLLSRAIKHDDTFYPNTRTQPQSRVRNEGEKK